MPITGNQKALMYARSGLMRSGASRSGYYNEVFHMTIGGIARGHLTRKYSPEIVKTLGAGGNTASVIVWGFTPAVGEEIIIGSGSIGNRLFGGTIVRVQDIHLKGKTFYLVDAVDWTRQLSRRLVSKRYTSQALHLIALDLISTFGVGFTANNVVLSSPTIDFIEFTKESMPSALTRLCARGASAGVRWNWYVDESKDVHVFDSEVSQAPRPLEAGNYSYWGLSLERDVSQRFTRAVVEGGGSRTTAGVAAGATSIPVEDCTFFSDTGGTLKSGSQSDITYTGRSASSGPGSLTGVPASGPGSITIALGNGQDVNLLAIVDDAASQAAIASAEGGDGIYERYFSDRRLSLAGATELGAAQLSQFAAAVVGGRYTTRDYFADIGKDLEINLPDRGVEATVPIHSVRIYRIAHDRWARDVQFSGVPRTDLTDTIRTVASPVGGRTAA